ncbi:putative Oxidoreductase [Streptomyces misionensis JCM 4497]
MPGAAATPAWSPACPYGCSELRADAPCATLVSRHSGFTGDNAANQPAGLDSRRPLSRGACWIRCSPCFAGSLPDLTSGSRSRDQLPKQALHGGAPSPAVADRTGPQNRICAIALLASRPVDRPGRARRDGAAQQRPPARETRQVVHRRAGVRAGPPHGVGARPRPAPAGTGRRRRPGRRHTARDLRAGPGDGGRGERELGRAAGRRQREGRLVHAAGDPRPAGPRALPRAGAPAGAGAGRDRRHGAGEHHGGSRRDRRVRRHDGRRRLGGDRHRAPGTGPRGGLGHDHRDRWRRAPLTGLRAPGGRAAHPPAGPVHQANYCIYQYVHCSHEHLRTADRVHPRAAVGARVRGHQPQGDPGTRGRRPGQHVPPLQGQAGPRPDGDPADRRGAAGRGRGRPRGAGHALRAHRGVSTA